jgi:glycerol-3-phosphate dehydrogenase
VNVPPSVTRDIPLVGADGHRALWNQRHEIAESSGVHVAAFPRYATGKGSCVLCKWLAALTDDIENFD